jgi:hypothetical protein
MFSGGYPRERDEPISREQRSRLNRWSRSNESERPVREEGPEAARELIAPRAFAFDGWSMVPFVAPERAPVAVEDILPDTEPAAA